MSIIVEFTKQWGYAPAIGIDLGTTDAFVAVYLKDGKVIKPDGSEVILNGEVRIIGILHNEDYPEERSTANCVAFTQPETLIGSPAKSRVFLNPENSIFEMKRMIGRKFDDPKIQQDMENWPFKVVNVDSVLKIRAEALGETKTFVPEEIIAIFLYKIKERYEMYFDGNTHVVGVVIAVPACFNDSQRQATMNAARIAGLRATLINEPTAAALAYGFEENLRGDKNVLIFDLGGGTLDASVINIKDGLRIEVKSTAGDSHLGGVDFDNLLVAHFIKEFKKKHRKDLQTCPKALRRLRNACEEAKRTLSSSLEAPIDMIGLFPGIRFYSKLTRAQFEYMCMDLFLSTLKPVERALSDAKMAKGSIDEIILIGGSTRIPKIKELLKAFFDGKEPLSYGTEVVDEAVVSGAAVYAAAAYRVADEKISSVTVVDITPVSFGIETIGGVMTPIFKRNSQIPCYMTSVFPTVVDNQSSIDGNVYEGEQAMAKDNRWVGRFTIQNIPPAPKGVPQIEVAFRLSASGFEVFEIVQPSLVTYLGLPNDEVKMMRDELLRLQEDENIRRERTKAKKDFERYLIFTKEELEEHSLPIKEFWMRFCDTQLEWMMTHPLADPKEIKKKHIAAIFEIIGYYRGRI